MIIIYNNKYYDITNFINKHPGGNHVFNNCNNMDLTQIINTSHKNVPNNILQNYYIGEADLNKQLPIMDFTKYNELKQLVYNHLDSNYKYSTQSFIIMAFQMIFQTAMSIAFFIQPSFLLALILGINSICYFGKMQHEASHNAVSNNPFINKILRYAILPFCSIDTWDLDHNLMHHQYTNSEKDGDSNPENVLYYNIYKEKKSYYKYQIWYYWFLTTIVILNKGFINSCKKCSSYHHLLEVITFGLFIICPALYHWSIYPILVCIIYSIAFTIVTQINHISEKTLKYSHQNDFLLDQINTSINYNTSFFTNYLSFGLSYQIEHHLFPSIAHEHYGKIQPIVMKYCLENNIPYYIENSLYDALKNYVKYLRDAPNLFITN